MRDLTPEEITELSARIQAGDLKAIDTARKATKPERVPKVRGKVTLTPEQKRLASLKREYAALTSLHSQWMEAKRAISGALHAPGAPRGPIGPDLMKHELFLSNNAAKLDAALESFLFSLKFHFSNTQ